MKVFVATCLFFALLIGLVVWSGVALTADVTEMQEMTQALARVPVEARAAQSEHLLQHWEARRVYFSLLVHRSEFERVEESLIEVVWLAKNEESDSDFSVAVAILQDAWRELATAVGFSVESVF